MGRRSSDGASSSSERPPGGRSKGKGNGKSLAAVGKGKGKGKSGVAQLVPPVKFGEPRPWLRRRLSARRAFSISTIGSLKFPAPFWRADLGR